MTPDAISRTTNTTSTTSSSSTNTPPSNSSNWNGKEVSPLDIAQYLQEQVTDAASQLSSFHTHFQSVANQVASQVSSFFPFFQSTTTAQVNFIPPQDTPSPVENSNKRQVDQTQANPNDQENDIVAPEPKKHKSVSYSSSSSQLSSAPQKEGEEIPNQIEVLPKDRIQATIKTLSSLRFPAAVSDIVALYDNSPEDMLNILNQELYVQKRRAKNFLIAMPHLATNNEISEEFKRIALKTTELTIEFDHTEIIKNITKALEYFKNIKSLSLPSMNETDFNNFLAQVENLSCLESLSYHLPFHVSTPFFLFRSEYNFDFTPFTKLLALKSMVISDITDSNIASLAKLPLLESLNLDSSMFVTNKGLALLADFPSLKSLTINLLCNEKITDFTVLILAKLSGLNSLSLRLGSFYDVTDKDLELLAEQPALCSLDLEYCSITDVCIASLAKLPNLTLNLAYCKNITDEGIANAEKINPNLKISKIGPIFL